ncbi:MAG: helix-turn-helix transcriptional regulator [Clostridia bacterium]|nr:helix-turn-helix transcriptional regulator [Clostridia bacterium]
MDSRQLLGLRVKAIQTQLGLSQEELAFRCGMHASHIGFLECGQRNPSLDTLERISLGLCVPLTALFDYENEPSTTIYDETTNKIISYVIGLSQSEKAQILAITKTFAKKPGDSVAPKRMMKNKS